MKYAKARVPTENRGRRLSLLGFVRVAALLTVGATLVMLAMMLLSADPQQWQVSGLLFLMTIAGIWAVMITIGCFVMIPVGLWRISKRLSQGIPGKVAPHGQLWDRWMDGPEPLVR